MVDEVKWDKPPAPRGERTARFKQLSQELKQRPGAWALAEDGMDEYRTMAATMASRISSGTLSAFRPAGEYEATSSKDKETGSTRLFIRYVGPGKIFRDFQETGKEAPPLAADS